MIRHFREIFLTWRNEHGSSPEVVKTPILRRWILALPNLSPDQFKLVLHYITETLGDDPSSTRGHFIRLLRCLPSLGQAQFEELFPYIVSHLHPGGLTLRLYAVSIFQLYSDHWRTPGFGRVFGHAVLALAKENPVVYGQDAAIRGVSLGLPRPSAILERRTDVSMPSAIEMYENFWRLANRAYREKLSIMKREAKLLGHFKRAWSTQKKPIARILSEAESLRDRGFHAASIVWACCAFEVFMTKVMIRACLSGLGLSESVVMDVVDEFFARNGKADQLQKLLQDYYRIRLPEKTWEHYREKVKWRHKIIHEGMTRRLPLNEGRKLAKRDVERTTPKRVVIRGDADQAVSAVKHLLEEIPTRISAALQPNPPRRKKSPYVDMNAIL